MLMVSTRLRPSSTVRIGLYQKHRIGVGRHLIAEIEKGLFDLVSEGKYMHKYVLYHQTDHHES